MKRSVAALAALATLALPPALSAQCQPDNLSGPCCALTTDTLPVFPALTLPGLSMCWDSCNLNSQSCAQVALGAPTQLQCAEYVASFQSLDCSANPQMKGTLHLDYTRTWTEFPIPGTFNQVWRFVVKADLGASTTTFGCVVPNCLGTHPTAFWYGYLDYAFDCGANTWEAALVLYHNCDAFQHDPLFSSRPGSFHPSRSFALVAPSTSANPFVPAIAIPTPGPVFFDGMRDAAVGPPPLTCESNEQIAGGIFANIVNVCACPLSFTPPQLTARHMDATSICGSGFRSLNLWPIIPWYEVMSTSLGTWTTSASYPGPEAVWADEGVFLHIEACTLSGALDFYIEAKYGATTEGGFLAAVGPVGALRFTDMVDNYSVLFGNPVSPPFFGAVAPTNHLLFVNVP